VWIVGEEPWERRERQLLRFLPPALLALGTLITVLQPAPSDEYRITLAVLIGAAAAWVLGLDTLNPSWKLDRPIIAVIYFVGLLVFTGLLILMAPWFGVFGFCCYIRAFDCLPGRWQFVGIGAAAPLMALSHIGGVPGLRAAGLPTYLVIVLINMTLAGAFAYFGWRTVLRDEKRRQVMAELAEANARLETALEENAGLHAQLVVQAREAGMLDERQRMAREIHDTLAQGLIGIITQLEAAESNPSRWQRHAATAVELARESLSEARRSVHAIRPEVLDNGRLPDALADVVKRWSEINAVPAEVTITGSARSMHPDVEVTLLRIVQEALANVAKHAKASRVGITLSYMDDLVSLDVRDDGRGFVRDEGFGPGFGLTVMRQRVEGIQGKLEIESEPGVGTAISATIPAGG
jgi:signal transduction histidine kinase